MADIVQRDTLSARLPDVTVLTTTTVVIPPTSLLKFDKKCFGVKNMGLGAWNSANLQATSIEVKDTTVEGAPLVPSGDSADWEDIDTTTFAALAPGALKTKQISADSHKWWRLIATVNTTASIARPYIDAGSI